MFDDDPSTAWVYSATDKESNPSTSATRYWILLEPDRPIALNELRIMNGQNQSRARFQRNDRVVQLRVTMDTGRNKIVRSFKLPDRMGWHTVKLPQHSVKALKLEFTRIRRGKGPDNDVCISEVALFNAGRKVNLGMPNAVMFYDGTEGCQGSYLISRSGKPLEVVANDVGFEDKWSTNGRYVSGAYLGRDNLTHLWVADAWRGKIMKRIVLRDINEYKWRNGSTLQYATGGQDGKKPVIRSIRL
jgi:hypothetical protein